jgi:hypothetical protein
MKINLEGYPVSISRLNPEDLKMLQDHYLPLVLNGKEDEFKGEIGRAHV